MHLLTFICIAYATKTSDPIFGKYLSLPVINGKTIAKKVMVVSWKIQHLLNTETAVLVVIFFTDCEEIPCYSFLGLKVLTKSFDAICFIF